MQLESHFYIFTMSGWCAENLFILFICTLFFVMACFILNKIL